MQKSPLSPLEAAKAAANPYAWGELLDRLACDENLELRPEEEVALRWHGLHRQRPLEAGLYMVRVKLPGGALRAEQLRAVADVAAEAGQEAISLTTRQGMEVHGLRRSALLGVMAKLGAAGLTTLGACGDVVRNVTACPRAGVCPHGIVDTTPLVQDLTAAFLGRAEFANLPRKLKFAVHGCDRNYLPAALNDVALVAHRSRAGTVRYALLVGGGLAASPRVATDLGVWVEPEQAVTVVTTLATIFRDFGNREQRGHARLKHLLADRGLPWLRRELQARLGQPLPARRPTPLSFDGRCDHLGLHAQRDPELRSVGVPVPAGRLLLAQARLIAELAETRAKGRLRVTAQQDLLLLDVPAEGMGEGLVALAESGLPVAPSLWQSHLVACTGKRYCNRGLVHTKEAARQLVAELDAELAGAGLTLGVSGCPSGCGFHAVSDVGLQGTTSGGEERFDLWLGGGATCGTSPFGRRVGARLRLEEVRLRLTQLVASYREEGAAGESFTDFARRTAWPSADAS